MANPVPTAAPAGSDLRAAIREILSPSWNAQVVIDAMLLAKGKIGAAGDVAQRLGFRNRFDLAAWFARQGLPPMHELAGWISVLSWLEQWERTGTALCPAAIDKGRDPAACYRLVQRITGVSWGQLHEAGMGWALERFAERCRHRVAALRYRSPGRYSRSKFALISASVNHAGRNSPRAYSGA